MKALLLLFCVLITHNIYSQTVSSSTFRIIATDTITVNPSLDQFIIKIYETDDEYVDQIININVVGDTILYQSFGIENGELNMDDDLMDINFDGYNDLEIVDYWGNSQNTFSSFWLFNPDLKKFEESKEYSEFGDITIDKVNKTITSWGASIGWNAAFSTSVYKVVDNHLVLIEDEYSCKFDSFRRVLEGDSLVTVSQSYAQSVEFPNKKDGDFAPDVLWIVTEEEIVYGVLRPIKKKWQWEYEGEGPKELYEKGILRYSEFGPTYYLKQEIIYNYSIDDKNNLFVDETITEVVNGELVKKSNPKTLIKE